MNSFCNAVFVIVKQIKLVVVVVVACRICSTCDVMEAMLVDRNNKICVLWELTSIFMQTM